ncbi:hypothetical protein Syun_004716 [Stephania yunnanensis]|uniref:Uncharacterized protein n=1 Tax=Stephania yunnanensis TaxID=152371 RepID=A0AAP0L7Q1_9MAGN
MGEREYNNEIPNGCLPEALKTLNSTVRTSVRSSASELSHSGGGPLCCISNAGAFVINHAQSPLRRCHVAGKRLVRLLAGTHERKTRLSKEINYLYRVRTRLLILEPLVKASLTQVITDWIYIITTYTRTFLAFNRGHTNRAFGLLGRRGLEEPLKMPIYRGPGLGPVSH